MTDKYREYKETKNGYSFSIPSHWRELPNRSFLIERNEINCDENARLLSLSQYTGVSPKRTDSKVGMSLSESIVGYKLVDPGEIVMNIMLAWNGSTACSGFSGVISPSYAVFQVVDKEISAQYLHYLFRLKQMCVYFKAFSTGIIEKT